MLSTTQAATRRRREVTARLSRLVEEAGGLTQFCERVWPRDDFDDNKAKAYRWQRGKSGIHPDEAMQVALAFGYRAAWLLCIDEGPEREGVTRTKAALADDLKAYVVEESAKAVDFSAYSWLSLILRNRIEGARLLEWAVEMVGEEMREHAQFVVGRFAVEKTIHQLEDAARSGEPFNPSEMLDLLRRIYSAPFPTGRAIVWPFPEVAPEDAPTKKHTTRRPMKHKPQSRRKS